MYKKDNLDVIMNELLETLRDQNNSEIENSLYEALTSPNNLDDVTNALFSKTEKHIEEYKIFSTKPKGLLISYMNCLLEIEIESLDPYFFECSVSLFNSNSFHTSLLSMLNNIRLEVEEKRGYPSLIGLLIYIIKEPKYFSKYVSKKNFSIITYEELIDDLFHRFKNYMLKYLNNLPENTYTIIFDKNGITQVPNISVI